MAVAVAWASSLGVGATGCAAQSGGARGEAGSTRDAAPKGPRAMVVATIHKGHLLQKGYPLGLLCKIVDAYRPDVVLVEVRPEAFQAGHYEDGPFEMTAVAMCAKARHIDVAPIDWWLESDLESREPSLSPEEAKAFEAERARLKEPTWPTFDLANSPAEWKRGVELLNAQARFLGGNPIWTRRQAWFHHRALGAIEQTHKRRALAFVGFNHAPELAAFLGSVGVQIDSPLSLDLGDPASANDPAPAEVVDTWRAGEKRLEEAASGLASEGKQRYAAKIRYFDVAVQRRGTCCVEEKELAPR